MGYFCQTILWYTEWYFT